MRKFTRVLFYIIAISSAILIVVGLIFGIIGISGTAKEEGTYLLATAIVLIPALLVSIWGVNKLNIKNMRYKSNLIPLAVCSLLFCGLLPGICVFVLTAK